MLRKILLTTLLLATTLAHAQESESASTQRDATEWLQIKVISVTNEDMQVRAIGVVLRNFVSETQLSVGDVVYIDYRFTPPTQAQINNGLPHPLAWYAGPPLLGQGEVSYAFLKSAGEEWIYEPAAGRWSFAPPVGIWHEVREALEMPYGQEAKKAEPVVTETTQEKEPEQPQEPEKYTLLILADGDTDVRVTSIKTGEKVYEESLGQGDFRAASGEPPLLIEASNFDNFKIETPDRDRFKLEPGKDYGSFRAAKL